MLEADRRDARIMDLGAGGLPASNEGAEPRPMAGAFSQQDQARRSEPGFDLIDGEIERCRRGVDPRVRRDGQELVEAGPGDGPGSAAFGERPNALVSEGMIC